MHACGTQRPFAIRSWSVSPLRGCVKKSRAEDGPPPLASPTKIGALLGTAYSFTVAGPSGRKLMLGSSAGTWSDAPSGTTACDTNNERGQWSNGYSTRLTATWTAPNTPPQAQGGQITIGATCGKYSAVHSSSVSPTTYRLLTREQLASSYFDPAEAERLREYIFLAGDSSTEPLSPTVRLGDSVLRVQAPCIGSSTHSCK